MILILECIVICFILFLPCVVVIANGIHNGAFLLEKDVQERVIQMGLITKEEIPCVHFYSGGTKGRAAGY